MRRMQERKDRGDDDNESWTGFSPNTELHIHSFNRHFFFSLSLLFFAMIIHNIVSYNYSA